MRRDMKDTGCRVVLVTAGSAEEAHRIADALVGEKKAACVSVLAGVSSVYRWQGKVEQAEEALLIIKTIATHLDDVVSLVRRMHSYTIPEIIALPVAGGSRDYLDWLGGEVSPA
jgi:periplasmic divalent cation tolerance protein